MALQADGSGGRFWHRGRHDDGGVSEPKLVSLDADQVADAQVIVPRHPPEPAAAQHRSTWNGPAAAHDVDS
jgi:hypothetical protein